MAEQIRREKSALSPIKEDLIEIVEEDLSIEERSSRQHLRSTMPIRSSAVMDTPVYLRHRKDTVRSHDTINEKLDSSDNTPDNFCIESEEKVIF